MDNKESKKPVNYRALSGLALSLSSLSVVVFSDVSSAGGGTAAGGGVAITAETQSAIQQAQQGQSGKIKGGTSIFTPQPSPQPSAPPSQPVEAWSRTNVDEPPQWERYQEPNLGSGTPYKPSPTQLPTAPGVQSAVKAGQGGLTAGGVAIGAGIVGGVIGALNSGSDNPNTNSTSGTTGTR